MFILYLTCLPHTVQLRKEIYIPKTVQHLSPENENSENNTNCVITQLVPGI